MESPTDSLPGRLNSTHGVRPPWAQTARTTVAALQSRRVSATRACGCFSVACLSRVGGHERCSQPAAWRSAQRPHLAQLAARVGAVVLPQPHIDLRQPCVPQGTAQRPQRCVPSTAPPPAACCRRWCCLLTRLNLVRRDVQPAWCRCWQLMRVAPAAAARQRGELPPALSADRTLQLLQRAGRAAGRHQAQNAAAAQHGSLRLLPGGLAGWRRRRAACCRCCLPTRRVVLAAEMLCTSPGC